MPPAGWLGRFITIWIGQTASLFGSMVIQFAMVWWFAQAIGSASALAGAGVVSILPTILIGPFAGPLIDRWNRRWVMIVADSLIALSTFVLVILFYTNQVEVWHVYLVLLFRSTCGVFHGPSMQASVPMMVPKHHLTRVAGMNQVISAAFNIISPTIGALLVMALPMALVLMIDVVTALLAVVPLLFIPIRQPERQITAGQQPSIWKDFREGVHYILAWKGLTYVFAIGTLLLFLGSPVSSFLPLLVTKYMKGNSLQLGVLNSVYGVGMLVGGILLGIWGGFKKKILTSILSVVGMGAGVAMLSLAAPGTYRFILVAIALCGFFAPLANGPLGAILQANVDADKQGRIFTLFGGITSLAVPVGLMLSGVLADRFGLPAIFLVSGAALIVMALLSLGISPIMQIESQRSFELKPEGEK